MQADLLSRLPDSTFRRVMINSYGLDFGASLSRTAAEQERVDALATQMTDALAVTLRAAYAFHVTEDMGQMVQGVAAALDETDVFHRDLAPTGCGMVRFERPMPITDLRGRTMKGHYLLWGPASRGGVPATLCTWFNDATDPDEVTEHGPPIPDAVAARLGRWRWIGADLIRNGQDVGPEAGEPTPEQADRIRAEGDTPGAFSNPIRYVHALWTLLGQSITTATEPDVDRATRRRAHRAGIPGRVSVIDLRRREGQRAEGETGVEWSHRWIQRQHMRWQPYGPRDADHVHALAPAVAEDGHMVRRCVHTGCEVHEKRIVIPAAVKGPEGLPLHVPDKVYRLSR